jgi:divalent metal cation (Fe/Co/Zn/Cd) transporter
LYFWSFIVALLVFAAGAGVSAYEGIQHIRRPEPATNHALSYSVLGISILFEGLRGGRATGVPAYQGQLGC